MNGQNLIIITSDELRGDCLGFMGNPDCKTPNLDAFAQKGIVFNNHFCVHGKCVPSRISMMTGRYAHTDGFRTIFQHLPEDQPNLMRTLKTHGYETAVFGHNHVWENFFGNNQKSSGVVDYHSFTEGYFSEMLKAEIPVQQPDAHQTRMEMVEGFDYDGVIDQDLTGFTDVHRTLQAIHYLKEVRDRERPFFLQLNLSYPHPRYNVEEPYFSMYDRNAIQTWPHELPNGAPSYMSNMRNVRTGSNPSEAFLREIQAVYYGMITKTDHLIGELLSEIEQQGLLENSVVLFTSDHGDFAGQYGLVEKWDTCLLDCIMHVPFVLYYPGCQPAKRVSGLSEHTDLAPTVCSLLEMDPDRGIHGTSLMPMVNGSGQKTEVFADGGHEEEMTRRMPEEHIPKEDRTAKQETYQTHPESMLRVKMVRTKEWKLVVRLDGEHELYHLSQDPNELNNVYHSEENTKVILDLQEKLLCWCMKTDTDRPYQKDVRA